MIAKKNKKHDKPLQIRVTKEQLDLFKRAAEADRRSVSDWARLRLEVAAERELKTRE